MMIVIPDPMSRTTTCIILNFLTKGAESLHEGMRKEKKGKLNLYNAGVSFYHCHQVIKGHEQER